VIRRYVVGPNGRRVVVEQVPLFVEDLVLVAEVWAPPAPTAPAGLEDQADGQERLW
jgi:hypothetical protein